ncbi:hypothetical protein BGZ57DRAFT_857379 [Hyaloscypha finlandica]|nr:hypothetical protein BGZ57DRAFT_857379 [Hyaloscypha finlandica]
MKTFAWLYSLLFSSSQPRASPLEISTYFENHSLSVVVQLDNVAGYPVAVHWGGGLLEDIQDSDELQVTCSGKVLPYIGMHVVTEQRPLMDDDFIVLQPKARLRRSISLPRSYDIQDSSGICEVAAMGWIEWSSTPARGGISEVAKVIDMSYLTKPIRINFNPDAGRRHIEELRKRIAAEPSGKSGCNSSEYADIRFAFFQARILAIQAANFIETRENLSMIYEYFLTTNSAQLDKLAAVYRNISQHADPYTAGASINGSAPVYYFCDDIASHCNRTINAYSEGARVAAMRGYWSVVVCPNFWKRPILEQMCHGSDRASILLHELSHVGAVLSQRTSDLNKTYGWAAIQKLNSTQRLQHADTVEMFAHDLTCVHL